jgi:protein gp37
MENSKIEWTHHTFNPWWGCTKVSAGCKHCYAETLSNRWKRAEWGAAGERKRTSDGYWRTPLLWNQKAAAAGRRERVFCASMAEVFEDKANQQEDLDNWRRGLFDLILRTPHLDWLLLTKRPQLVNWTIERVTGFSDSEMWFHAAQNVWIGTSVENQEQADIRIPELLKIPAHVRFLSMEPLLERVYLDPEYFMTGWTGKALSGIDWVIAGGESGAKARPMHLSWVRPIRDQCAGAGVPFFFKQWGEWAYVNDLDDGGEKFAKVGKNAAGRLLDGCEWNEFPSTAVGLSEKGNSLCN